jgi:hypothetical protein
MRLARHDDLEGEFLGDRAQARHVREEEVGALVARHAAGEAEGGQAGVEPAPRARLHLGHQPALGFLVRGPQRARVEAVGAQERLGVVAPAGKAGVEEPRDGGVRPFADMDPRW